MATAEIRKGHTVALNPDAVKSIPAIHMVAVQGREFKVKGVRRRGETRMFEVGDGTLFPASWFNRVIKS